MTCAGCGAELTPSPHGRPRKWCSARCRKQTLYSTPCVDCGVPTNGSDGFGAHQRCRRCNGVLTVQHTIKVLRKRWAPHRAMIEAMWADGLSIREIQRLAGVPSFRPGPYRQKGYDLPYRYPTENGKRIRGPRITA